MPDSAKPARKSQRPDAAAPAVDSDSWRAAVVEAVRTMRYGTIQITVQDSKVALIERIDRSRLEIPAKSESTPP